MIELKRSTAGDGVNSDDRGKSTASFQQTMASHASSHRATIGFLDATYEGRTEPIIVHYDRSCLLGKTKYQLYSEKVIV